MILLNNKCKFYSIPNKISIKNNKIVKKKKKKPLES